jgi:hypothetical protein
MERSNTERVKDAPDIPVARWKKSASTHIPRHHERWLVQSGFAVRRDGRLRPTAYGRKIGAALFGYTR